MSSHVQTPIRPNNDIAIPPAARRGADRIATDGAGEHRCRYVSALPLVAMVPSFQKSLAGSASIA
jgi:hypothetical protein